jgi:hypothetical protein
MGLSGGKSPYFMLVSMRSRSVRSYFTCNFKGLSEAPRVKFLASSSRDSDRIIFSRYGHRSVFNADVPISTEDYSTNGNLGWGVLVITAPRGYNKSRVGKLHLNGGPPRGAAFYLEKAVSPEELSRLTDEFLARGCR